MMKKLEDMRVVDLRAELDQRGLDKTGIKAVLIERLRKSIQSDGDDPDEFECANQSRNKSMLDEEEDSFIEPDANNEDKEPTTDGGTSRKSLTRARDSPLTKKETPTKAADECVNVEGNEESQKTKEIHANSMAESKVAVLKKEPRQIEIKDVHEQNTIEEINLEDDDDIQEIEDEILDEEDKGDSGPSREEYNRHMEDESINLMLEDDDKMLDYEENDRIDMEEVSNADCKEKEEGNSVAGGSTSGTPSKKESSVLQEPEKNEKDNAKSSKGQEESKENDEKKENKSSAATGNSRNLWVSGLAPNTRAQDLKTLFSKHGKVLSAKIVTNAKTPGAKCFGFVTMSTLEDANKCIEFLTRTELHGRMIQVEKAKGEPGGPKPQPPTSKSGNSTQSKDSATSKTGDSKEGEKSRGGDPSSQPRKDSSRKEENGKEKGPPERRGERSRGGKTSPHNRLAGRGGEQDRERDRRNKGDARRLSAKDRVVDRRHEKNGPFPDSRSKRSPPRRDVLSFNRIVEERERQRLRTRDRLMREEERMRRDEEMHLRELERRQKEEAQKLMREREKLRIERERVERQKQELLRLEREQQRIERERLERERDELRKQQMKYEEVRRGVKRPAPLPAERDRREFFDNRKRPATDRPAPPSRMPDRGGADRGGDRGLNRVPDRAGMMRGSDRGAADRGGSLRGSDRGPLRGPDRSGSDRRFTEESRDSRYGGGGDRVSQMRSGNSAYDNRRPEREERRPVVDRSVSSRGGDARDHHRSGGPPPMSMRDRQPQRDSHYNGGGMGNMSGGSWHTGSHSSKSSGPTYGSNVPSMISGAVSGSSVSGRSGADSQGGWRPASNSVPMSTNERWGGGSSSAMGGRNNSMMDILRSADSYHMGSGQPVNTVPVMSNMSQDRFGSMGNFRK